MERALSATDEAVGAAIDGYIAAIAERLSDVRRHLHRHPEPSREERATASFLRGLLVEAGIAVRVVADGRGLIAGELDRRSGPCVAIRADIDALRIQDAKAVAYRSTRDGLMHACGHDAHATMALGAALALHRLGAGGPAWRAVFQPAEEVGEGAEEMVAAGAIEGVDAILALHVDPELDVGRVGRREGVLTALCQSIAVSVVGRGGHAARPHLAADPIAAVAQFVTAAYQALPRSLDVREPVVVSFGAIHGGTSCNVLPDRVDLLGTLRAMGRSEAAQVRDRLARVARGVAELAAVEIALEFGPAVDAVLNDPLVTAAFGLAAAQVVGPEGVTPIPLPSLGSEDFAAYVARVPGCMLRLGVGSGPRPRPGLHHPLFDIDERALVIGAKLLARGVVEVASAIGRGEDS